MQYLILPSAAEAEARSQQAWQDKIGHEVSQGADTLYRWGVRPHPTDGRAALEVDGDQGLLTAAEQAALVEVLPGDWTPSGLPE